MKNNEVSTQELALELISNAAIFIGAFIAVGAAIVAALVAL